MQNDVLYNDIINEVTTLIEESSADVVDYVVEEDTSDIWTYRKWASGVAECWCKKQITITSWSVWGALYEGTPSMAPLNFPTDLFNAIPCTTATLSLDGVSGGTLFEMGRVSQSTIDYIIPVRPTEGGTPITYNASIYAIGRWK